MEKHKSSNSVNHSWKLIIQFVSLFCLCCFLVISCSQPQNKFDNAPTIETNTNRITIGTTLKSRTIDPADAYEVISGNLLYNLGDRLYGYKLGTTELVPQLATKMPKISEDGTTYTIPIRQGVTFHDGTPFNAEAMAFSLKRFIKNSGPPSSLLTNTVESIEATGEYQLTIKLKKPFAAFTPLLAFSGLCAVSPQAYTIDENQFKPDTFIGTGPYKLAEYGTDILRLDAFENYWGEKAKNQGIDIQIFSSSANLFNAFKTGAIDIAYFSLDTDQITNLEAEAPRQGWQVIATDGKTVNYMVLNLNLEPLNNKAVRQALASIIDRKLLNERVLQGKGEPVYSLIPKKFDGYKPVFKENYGDGNFEKAKELLKEAGYSRNSPAKIEIWYAANSTKRQLTASTLKASVEQKLEGLMELELKSVEAATAFQNLDKGVYQTFILDWYGDFIDADNYIQPFLECTKGSKEKGCEEGASQFQGSFYYSARINKLIQQQRQEQNPEKRQAIFREIQELLGEDVPFIPLWLDKDYVFVQKDISGVSLEPTQQFPFWTIKL